MTHTANKITEFSPKDYDYIPPIMDDYFDDDEIKPLEFIEKIDLTNTTTYAIFTPVRKSFKNCLAILIILLIIKKNINIQRKGSPSIYITSKPFLAKRVFQHLF